MLHLSWLHAFQKYFKDSSATFGTIMLPKLKYQITDIWDHGILLLESTLDESLFASSFSLVLKTLKPREVNCLPFTRGHIAIFKPSWIQIFLDPSTNAISSIYVCVCVCVYTRIYTCTWEPHMCGRPGRSSLLQIDSATALAAIWDVNQPVEDLPAFLSFSLHKNLAIKKRKKKNWCGSQELSYSVSLQSFLYLNYS